MSLGDGSLSSGISLHFLSRRSNFQSTPVPYYTVLDFTLAITQWRIPSEVRRIVQLKKEGRVSVWSSSNIHYVPAIDLENSPICCGLDSKKFGVH